MYFWKIRYKNSNLLFVFLQPHQIIFFFFVPQTKTLRVRFRNCTFADLLLKNRFFSSYSVLKKFNLQKAYGTFIGVDGSPFTLFHVYSAFFDSNFAGTVFFSRFLNAASWKLLDFQQQKIRNFIKLLSFEFFYKIRVECLFFKFWTSNKIKKIF